MCLQHKHRGAWSALQDIYGSSGIRGLWRGAVSLIPTWHMSPASQEQQGLWHGSV